MILDLLSIDSVDIQEGGYPNSVKIFLIHLISFPASITAIYLASLLDRVTKGCYFDNHPTVPSYAIVIYLSIEQSLSLHTPCDTLE